MSGYKKMSALELRALLSLAELGACTSLCSISSSRLSRHLGVSQQSAARRIIALEQRGYIEREVNPKGQLIRVNLKGKGALKSLHHLLKEVFEEDESSALFISGEVISGMGDGSYYMSLKEYFEQFRKKLGFLPYRGTLNLRLKTEEDIRVRRTLEALQGIQVKGFARLGRVFGGVRCFRSEIEGVKCAVVIPDKTHHSLNTIEVIAEENLRERLNLEDSEVVNVKILT